MPSRRIFCIRKNAKVSKKSKRSRWEWWTRVKEGGGGGEGSVSGIPYLLPTSQNIQYFVNFNAFYFPERFSVGSNNV